MLFLQHEKTFEQVRKNSLLKDNPIIVYPTLIIQYYLSSANFIPK